MKKLTLILFVVAAVSALAITVIWIVGDTNYFSSGQRVVKTQPERPAIRDGEADAYTEKEKVAIEFICNEGATVYEHKFGTSITFGPMLPPLPPNGASRVFEPKEVRMWTRWNADNTNPSRTAEALRSLARLRRVGYIDLDRYPLPIDERNALRVALPGTRIVHVDDYSEGN